jgi:hypothetical protein
MDNILDADLINIAYSFFPKGISYELEFEKYIKTTEFKRLEEFSEKGNHNNKQWKEFLKKVEDTLVEIRDVGHSYSKKRCFQTALIINKESTSSQLVLCISKLVPLFCFYSKTTLEYDNHNINYLFNEDFTTNETELISFIEKNIIKYFPTYSRVSNEKLNVELINIEFEELGKLKTNPFDLFYRRMTIFTALFSSSVYY